MTLSSVQTMQGPSDTVDALNSASALLFNDFELYAAFNPENQSNMVIDGGQNGIADSIPQVDWQALFNAAVGPVARPHTKAARRLLMFIYKGSQLGRESSCIGVLASPTGGAAAHDHGAAPSYDDLRILDLR